MDEENRLLKLEGLDETYVGVHTVTFDIDLTFFANFNSPITDSTVVYVLQSCNTTEFLMSPGYTSLNNMTFTLGDWTQHRQVVPQYYTSVGQ